MHTGAAALHHLQAHVPLKEASVYKLYNQWRGSVTTMSKVA